MTAPVHPGLSASSGGPAPSLARRELDVLIRVANGESYPEIAAAWFVEQTTVRKTVFRAIRKMQANSLAHAIHIVHELGLLDPDPTLVLPSALREVLELVADGRTNSEISRILGRSEHTVADQVREVRRRLGARDRAHAVALAMDARLIRRPSRVVTAA